MKKCCKMLCCFAILVIVTERLGAQDVGRTSITDNVSEFSIAGSVDAYFHKSFRRTENAPRTSFANLPGFSLGMINLIAGYKTSKSGFVADLVFGPRGSDAVFQAPYHRNSQGTGSAHMINQMYAYYQISKAVRINLGQFNTFLGYETISPVNNFHYSTSYLFSYGPFNHTGVWADVGLSDAWSAKLAVMNPTDYTEFNPFNTYIVGGQIGFSVEKGMAFLNATYGDPDGRLKAVDSIGCISLGNVLQADFTMSWDVFTNYSLRIGTSVRTCAKGQIKTNTANENSAAAKHGFYGITVYHEYRVSDALALGLRAEYFQESNQGVGAIGGYDNNGDAWVYDLTLSANISSQNFKVIPELRLDKTSGTTYTNASTGVKVDQLVSTSLAVVYTLPTISHYIKGSKHLH